MEYRQLLGLGRAAAAYGQTTAARQLYEAAGAWTELLSLCALQGDFMSVRDYMQSVHPLLYSQYVGLRGAQHAKKVLKARVFPEALASAPNLSNVNPSCCTFRRASWGRSERLQMVLIRRTRRPCSWARHS